MLGVSFIDTMHKRHPLLFFFGLAFLLSWYPWLLFLIRGSGSPGPNPLGVFLAAVLVTATTYGRRELKELLARVVRWRVGIQWYALIFLLPLMIGALATVVLMLFGALPDFSKIPPIDELAMRFMFILLFIGLGEEPGWRGFALDHLQRKRSATGASVILACIWAVWHVPLMGHEFTLPVIPAFLIALFAATFIQTWIYNNTERSILLQMFFHAAVNTIGAGAIFQLFTGPQFVIFWYVYAAMWLAVAAILLLTGQLKPVHVSKTSQSSAMFAGENPRASFSN
jgi:membrane protease YdiL (CAAX protease family)